MGWGRGSHRGDRGGIGSVPVDGVSLPCLGRVLEGGIEAGARDAWMEILGTHTELLKAGQAGGQGLQEALGRGQPERGVWSRLCWAGIGGQGGAASTGRGAGGIFRGWRKGLGIGWPLAGHLHRLLELRAGPSPRVALGVDSMGLVREGRGTGEPVPGAPRPDFLGGSGSVGGGGRADCGGCSVPRAGQGTDSAPGPGEGRVRARQGRRLLRRREGLLSPRGCG